MTFKRGDLVVTKTMPLGPVGLVTRIARDGSWVDLEVRQGGTSWRKRMRTDVLISIDDALARLEEQAEGGET